MFGEKTRVLGRTVYIPVEQLYQNHYYSAHRRLLRSYSTKTDKWTKVKPFAIRKGYREELIRVFLENGMTLVVTPDQPFWSDKGKITIAEIKKPYMGEDLYRHGEWNIGIRENGNPNIGYSRLIRVSEAPPQHVYEVRMFKSFYTCVVDGFVLCNVRGKNGKRKKDAGSGILARSSAETPEGSTGVEETAPKKKPQRRPRGPQRWIRRRRKPGEAPW